MSTKGKEYKLAIRIAGVVDKSFSTSLATTRSALAANIKAIDSDFTTLDKGFNKIMKVGQTCFHAIATAAGVAATAIGAAVGASIYVGSDFESAFAGVKKTVDATEEEYEALRQSILSMTDEIPASASEIASVMEIAGQLGIAKESLADFTETMINMGVSTNLSSEEAATNLAKFASIMTMSAYGEDGISNYERLGSTVVDLGNKLNATEEEIVNISTQLAAAGQLAGMSEADIMGISAAMASVGLTAEAGASSMSRLIMQMQQSVSEGGDSLTTYAETAGMTAEEFSTLFGTDAAGAVVAFIGGLNAAGEDSYGILEDLELSTIRTRKAFLSLAGADGLMANALGLANGAWDENTALAIEAAKRYETAESKVQLRKNAFTEAGITAYDELRDPYVSVIDTITEKAQELNDYVGGADGISKWMDNIGTALPTLQRKVKQYGQPILDFLEPLVNLVKAFANNPEETVSIFVGIGSALATYKVASSAVHLINSLISLAGMSGFALTILGIAGAVGALGTALSYMKAYEQEQINNNLADHFGNIALSMEELQAVAENIISSESLAGVKEALGAFDDLGTLTSEIESNIKILNRKNWKVSIGMKLTEDEQTTYITAIDGYVSAAQAYAEESQYAVYLNLKALVGDSEDPNAQSAVDKVNQFYSDQSAEMTALGKQLNDAVTEAFNDGLLDIKEAEKIAQIQADMAKIQESLATGEFDAKMSLLQMEFAGGGSLAPNSFMNLQAELDKQVEVATEAYRESYTKAYASIEAANANGDYLTEAEYQAALDGIYQSYLQNVGDIQARALNFQMETIMGQYSEELSTAIPGYMENIQTTLEEYAALDGFWLDTPAKLMGDMINEISQMTTLDDTTKGAISQLLEALQPTISEMQTLKSQYEEIGAEVPQAIVDGLNNFDMLNAMANGDFSSVSEMLGQQMVEGGTFDTFFQDIFNRLATEQPDFQIPETLASGIATATAEMAATEVTAAGEAAIPPAVDGVYSLSQSTIDSTYAQGFDTTATLRITLDPTLTNLSAVSRYVSSSTSGLSGSIGIGKRAKGGLATSPELTWFAEEGPEMAIPIKGGQRSIDLWEQTGRLLGMDSVLDGVDLGSSGGGSSIEYKPTLQFYGEAPSKSDITDALRISQDEFEGLMARYLKTQGRVSF